MIHQKAHWLNGQNLNATEAAFRDTWSPLCYFLFRTETILLKMKSDHLGSEVHLTKIQVSVKTMRKD